MKPIRLCGIYLLYSTAASASECSAYKQCVVGPWTGNQQCIYNGVLWKANWWTNSLPTATDPAWTRVVTCDNEVIVDICDGVANWNPSETYDQAGTLVVYDDALWSNKWWSGPGVAPAVAGDNWVRVGDCRGHSETNPTLSPPPQTVEPPVVHPTSPRPVQPTNPPTTKISPTIPKTSTTPRKTSTTTPSRATTTTSFTPKATTPTENGNEVRPTGPTGSKGECVWPEWDSQKTYKAGNYVGMGQDVFSNTYYADKGMSPTSGGPWQKVATCTGAPPKSKYTLEEMQAMLDPNDHSYQVVYDPWTPLLPTEAEMRQAEADYRSTPLAKAIVNVNRMLPVEEVEKVSAGRAENPQNVRRVESILPEALFNKFFPVRHKAYTYDHFLKSVALFPAYCDTYTDGRDSDAICKKVLATSFAHYVQETGANHGSLYYKGAEHASDNINDDADQWYKVGEKLEKVNQALWFLREVGYTENAGGDAYRSCGLVSGNMFFQLTYPCGEGVSYFGRGSKQLSWNYNYGPFSQQVYGDPKVLLNDPSSVADSWLNFASGFWFSVTPQSPKPPMLWVIDGTWVPNEADLAAGRTPGFGATINIINGGLECNGANHPGPANRQAAYFYFMEQLGLTVDPNEDTDCKRQKPFDQSSSAATESYYTMNWSGEAKCDITSSQTAWQLSRDGDYARCVKYFFRSHWFKDGELISDYGLAPGQTYS